MTELAEYFEDWGTKKNPIRQSDLNALFGSVFKCPKRYAIAKMYPKEDSQVSHYKQAMDEILHDIIARKIKFDTFPHLRNMINFYMRKRDINYRDKDQDKTIEEYKLILKKFSEMPMLDSFLDRKLEVERAFMVKVGSHWVAGTVDFMMKGKKKGEIVVIDWKTGPPASQYQMDKGYQTRIYCHAVKEGEFFLRPDSMRSGHGYYKSYQKTLEKNKFGVVPKMIYGHLRDLLPASKKSSRKQRHYSTLSWANDKGEIKLEKGDQHGPCFYETKAETQIERLAYSLDCAVMMAKSGIFPEAFGDHCEKCIFLNRCETLGTNVQAKQQVFDIMEDLGIEPT